MGINRAVCWVSVVLMVAATVATSQTKSVDSVKIGNLFWTKKNINIETAESWCYNNSPDSCAKYGRLYTWKAAGKACAGLGAKWRLPTNDDWATLRSFAGGEDVAGKRLKSKAGWESVSGINRNGRDDYGFNALPGGKRGHVDGSYYDVGKAGEWWSATKRGSSEAFYMTMNILDSFDDDRAAGSELNGSSVRCVATDPAARPVSADAAAKAGSAAPIVTGKMKPVDSVKIGNLIWTKQNISIETAGSWCYDNDPANCTKYGRLYTWEAAKIACQLMGNGWRLPGFDDLVKHAGGDWRMVGKRFKAKSGWYDEGEEVNGTDDYGFSALPGGIRRPDGTFAEIGIHGHWWEGGSPGGGNGGSRGLYNISSSMRGRFHDQGYGFSVRCAVSPTAVPVAAKTGIGGAAAANTAQTKSSTAAAANTAQSKPAAPQPASTAKINPDGSATIANLIWTGRNIDIEVENSWCYDNDPVNCAKYGRLYTRASAEKACRSMGEKWRLPTRSDWTIMTEYVTRGSGRTITNSKDYGTPLKATSGWDSLHAKNNNGRDTYGFSALPGGERAFSSFRSFGGKGFWWEAKGDGAGVGTYFSLQGLEASWGQTPLDDNDATIGYSARCVADNPEFKYPDDRIKIGTRYWTKENLNINTPGSWCYEGKSANCKKYGRLYTWEGANRACDRLGSGWELSDNSDWNELISTLGGGEVAGKKLKSKSGWGDVNGKSGSGTDDYGFSALPGGFRSHSDEAFDDVGSQGTWWSETDHMAGSATSSSFGVRNYNDRLNMDLRDKRDGFSARCVSLYPF